MMNGNVSLGWRGFGDSEIGSLHRHFNLPNQDAYSLKLESYPISISLSDGLGSKTLSHLGAQAVTRAVERLACSINDGMMIEPLSLIESFHKFWLEELEGIDIEQCFCTALFAIVCKEQTFIAQLGDGDCCIVTSNQDKNEKQVCFLMERKEDLFVNQTYSLGQELRINQWKFCLKPTAEFQACFLVTDGIADDLVEPKANFYLELLNQYQGLTDEQIEIDVRHWISQWPVIGHSDDRTIVAIFHQNL